MPTTDNLFTVADVAREFGVTQGRINQLLMVMPESEKPGRVIGRTRVFTESDYRRICDIYLRQADPKKSRSRT